MYTEDQIEVAKQRAKDAGWNDAQINQAIGEISNAGLVKRKGFLQRAGEAIVRPLMDYGALVGEAGRQAFNYLPNQLSQNKIDSLLKQQQELMQNESLSIEQKKQRMDQLDKQIQSLSQGIERSTTPVFMSSPKRQYAFEKMSGDIGEGALYGARKGAGAASYLIPAGGAGATAGARIGSAAGRGALIGGLRTFGEDYTGAGEIAGGALGGAAFGAAFQGAGEAYRGLRNQAPRLGGAVEQQGKKASLQGLKPTPYLLFIMRVRLLGSSTTEATSLQVRFSLRRSSSTISTLGRTLSLST